MATRGNVAKEAVAQKIINTFGENYVATVDKKIYVNAVENGETIQIAISMTCPKNPVSSTNNSKSTGNLDFSGSSTPVEISPEDDAKVTALMKKLGISD